MEFIIELFKVFEDLFHMRGWVHQISDSEVVCTFLLSKSWPRYCHDTGFIDHFHAINEVRLFILPFGLVNELLREMNSREGIHSSFNLGAAYLLHVIESIWEKLRAFSQTIKNLSPFALVLVDAIGWFSSNMGWVNHEIYTYLTNRVWTKFNRFEFVENLFCLIW